MSKVGLEDNDDVDVGKLVDKMTRKGKVWFVWSSENAGDDSFYDDLEEAKAAAAEIANDERCPVFIFESVAVARPAKIELVEI